MKLDREGTFIARAACWALNETKSGALKVTTLFQVEEGPDANGQMCSWLAAGGEYAECYVSGDFFIIDSHGDPIPFVVEALVKALDWDGEIDTISHSDPSNDQVRIKVEAETYTDKKTGEVKTVFNVAYVDPLHSVQTRIDADGMRRIKSQHAGRLRALAQSKGAKKRKVPETTTATNTAAEQPAQSTPADNASPGAPVTAATEDPDAGLYTVLPF